MTHILKKNVLRWQLKL